MENLINDISQLCESFVKDATLQLQDGNKTAGRRARRTSLDMEPLLKKYRKMSLEMGK